MMVEWCTEVHVSFLFFIQLGVEMEVIKVITGLIEGWWLSLAMPYGEISLLGNWQRAMKSRRLSQEQVPQGFGQWQGNPT